MNALRIVIPLTLGLIAGVINFYAVRGTSPPIDLVAVKEDTKAGTEIRGPDMLVKVRVRADAPDILKSAVPWADRGVLLNRKLNRPMAAGEVILFADVQPEGVEDVASQLRPGEVSFTFPVRASRIAPGLRPGDTVAVVVDASEGGDEKGLRRVVPVRLLAVGEREAVRGMTGEEMRKVTVAVAVNARRDLSPEGVTLDTALTPTEGDRRGRILAVEFYRPGAGK